jgi:predicted nucleic acid-binding protein
VKVALDSNVLLYAAGVWKVESEPPKTAAVRAMIDRLHEHATIVCPWQVFGESYRVMLRHGRGRGDLRAVIIQWQKRFETIGSAEPAFRYALDLATDHKLQFWDALILNAAADAGCTLLLSEDLQAGFAWRGVTVANPFAEVPDRQLVRAMGGDGRSG